MYNRDLYRTYLLFQSTDVWGEKLWTYNIFQYKSICLWNSDKHR